MSFSWGSMLEGLDNSLDVVTKIAAVIPGGQKIAAGAALLDTVVESARENNPVEDSLNIVEAVVQSKTKGVSIDNSSVLNFLEAFARSTNNTVDDQLVEFFKCYLKAKQDIK